MRSELLDLVNYSGISSVKFHWFKMEHSGSK